MVSNVQPMSGQNRKIDGMLIEATARLSLRRIVKLLTGTLQGIWAGHELQEGAEPPPPLIFQKQRSAAKRDKVQSIKRREH